MVPLILLLNQKAEIQQFNLRIPERELLKKTSQRCLIDSTEQMKYDKNMREVMD